MEIFHFNDEERELHHWLAERGHRNTILGADANPFAVVRKRPFDAAFVGLHPHGLQLIRELQAINPSCLVTIITADRNTRMAVEAMRAGAFDFLISPPLNFTEVDGTYIRLSREWKMQQERVMMLDRLAMASAGTKLVGISEPLQNLRRLVAKAAVSRAPVLIMGETGTGKELVARLLHEQGPRADKPFVGINCNAIPSTLLESELLGFKKGAFTGADSDHDGLLIQADGGTAFLDEIQDLELPLQGKLLRVLQENEVRPLGSKSTRKLNTRFVAATNQDIPALIHSRKFRQDLFYRLNVVPIVVPSLRDRPEDITLLARYFIELYCRREGREPLKVTPAVWRWMSTHPWPGNVRELENLCQRAVALSDGDAFDTDVLSLTGSFAHHSSPAPSANPMNDAYRMARKDLDRKLLERALEDWKGNVSRAAAALNISRTTFYAKARLLGLDLPGRSN